MSRRANATRGRASGRGQFIWIFGAIVFVAAMLYWEQVALLYVRSTLAVSALLLVVAFSGLKGWGGELNSPAPGGDAAAEGPGATASAPSPGKAGAAHGERRKRKAARPPTS